jgi:hypothetical protein
VIEFEFPGDPSRCNYWFVIELTGASVCLASLSSEPGCGPVNTQRFF